MAQVSQLLLCRQGCYLLLSSFWIAALLPAQENLVPAADLENVLPATPQSQPVETKSGSGLVFTSLTRTSQGRARAGSMVVLRAAVRNSADHSAAGVLVSKVTGYAGEEYRRSFQLNAREEKSFTLAVRVPDKSAAASIEVSVTLNVLEGGREVMLMRRNDEPASQTIQFPLVSNEVITALAIDDAPPEKAYWRWPKAERFATYEFAVTTRVEASLTRICAMLDDGPFPLNLSDWDSIDVLIISAAYIFDDATAIAAIQQFMQHGGRVWIMLDRIETSAIRELLVGPQQCETLDTVELNRFVVDVPNSSLIEADRTVDRDKPVRLKRVLQQGGQVTHSIDGWPIAIWYPVGSGELLLTTLDSDAWLLPNSTHRSPDPVSQSNFKLPLWASTFGSSVNTQKATPRFVTGEVNYPVELIGNPVVSFRLVAAVLFGFCFILAAFGLWRIFSAGDLDWLGGFAPAIALIACVPLIVVAVGMRRDIPAMITKLQIIQLGQTGGGSLREIAAVYSTQNQAMTLNSVSDGIVKPSRAIESGVRKSTVDDFQSWQLSNQDWPTGTWRYETEIALNQPAIKATAELTSRGMIIEVPKNLPTPVEDVVLSFAIGRTSLGTLIDGNQRLLFDGQIEAGGERWTTDAIVGDEQRRRADVYSELFSPQLNQHFPSRALYGWTGMWAQSPQWDVDFEQRGAALVSVPIELSIPEVGSEVYIPHSLVSIEPSPYATGISSIYNFRSGRWTEESTLATNAYLSFVLPPEVVPLEATSVKFEWDVAAPKRTARLLNQFDGKVLEIVALNEPSIPWQATLNDPQVLADLRDGRLELQIEVADHDDLTEAEKSSFISWRIKHLRVSVSGRTLPRDNLSAQRATAF